MDAVYLLHSKLGGDLGSAFGTATGKDFAAVVGFHASAESGFVGVFDFGWLVSLFHIVFLRGVLTMLGNYIDKGGHKQTQKRVRVRV